MSQGSDTKMYPGNSLIRNDKPGKGGDSWDPFAVKSGGKGIQFSGVLAFVRSVPGPKLSMLAVAVECEFLAAILCSGVK